MNPFFPSGGSRELVPKLGQKKTAVGMSTTPNTIGARMCSFYKLRQT